MGASDRRLFEIRDIIALENKREIIQKKIDDSKSLEDRRQHGQFATPIELAREIVAYGLSLHEGERVSFLEPAFGTGAIYSALMEKIAYTNKELVSATGMEIDKDYFKSAVYLWRESGVNLINCDYTKQECQVSDISLFITNPPYVRHHYIDKNEKKALRAAVIDELNINISQLSGLYCYFLLLSHKWLINGAICGWLIPTEFMDVNYGSAIKDYLLNHVHLLRVHRYDPIDSKFNDSLVSSCVVWFKKEIVDDYNVEFTYGGTHEKPIVTTIINKKELFAEKKWTQYSKIQQKTDDKKIAALGDYFDIKRGIATGDNEFFIINKDKIKEYAIDFQFLLPILPSPRNLKSDIIEKDNDKYPVNTEQLFLINCKMSEDEVKEINPALFFYLNNGKETTALKYLCRNRRVWYWQEERKPTLFLCSYMGRSCEKHSRPFRFILNNSNAIVTNSYLMLYPKKKLDKLLSERVVTAEDIWKALNTIEANDMEKEGRTYGGGLKKIEPKELAKVKCLALQEIIEAH